MEDTTYKSKKYAQKIINHLCEWHGTPNGARPFKPFLMSWEIPDDAFKKKIYRIEKAFRTLDKF